MIDKPSCPMAFALGSNLGDSLGALRKALAALGGCVKISAVSSVYRTAPAYVLDQPPFLNAVVAGTTWVEPLPLLWEVKRLEREIGRTPTFRYGPRVIDIDILFYGDVVLETPELTIPHARMQERDFVLRPLSECMPMWRHPVIMKTATEMLDLMPRSDMVCLGRVLT